MPNCTERFIRTSMYRLRLKLFVFGSWYCFAEPYLDIPALSQVRVVSVFSPKGRICEVFLSLIRSLSNTNGDYASEYVLQIVQ